MFGYKSTSNKTNGLENNQLSDQNVEQVLYTIGLSGDEVYAKYIASPF